MQQLDIQLAVVWYAVFLFSTCCHEASHAWVAMRLGDLTAYKGGQVSLNPIPHIRREVIGMVVAPIIFLLTQGWIFGWASAPMDPYWRLRNPRGSAWVSLAGPTANLILLLASALAIRIGLHEGWFVAPNSVHLQHMADGTGPLAAPVAVVLGVFFSLNLILFCLNLLPLPPLDGSGAIGLLLNEDTARKWQVITAQPAFGIVGLIIVWNFFGYMIQPIFLKVVNVVYWGYGSYGNP